MPNVDRKTRRRDRVEIYLHLLWTTWDRLPLVQREWEKQMFLVALTVLAGEKCRLIALNGVEDHVHCLVAIRSTTRLCDVMKALKGATANFARTQSPGFRWRPTYAAFSVSRWDVEMVKNYIRGQKRHHQEGTTESELECFDEEYFLEDEAV